MATKQQVLGKIVDLLTDINAQFDDLEKDAAVGDVLKGDLFEATVNYLAANVAVYNKLQKAEREAMGERSVDDAGADPVHPASPATDDSDNEEIVFTPASDTTEEQSRPTDEIEEEISAEGPGNDAGQAETDSNDDGVQDSNGGPGHDQADDEQKAPGEKTEADPQAPDDEEGDVEKPVSDESDADVSSEQIDQEVSEAVVIGEKTVEIADERPARPLSLNERLSAQRKAGGNPLTAVRRDGERISDLKSAISLNDKLLFIKDLFNGYSLAYSEAIELLNRYDDFADADAFLQTNYAQKNNWVDKPETVGKLYAILRKRFG